MPRQATGNLSHPTCCYDGCNSPMKPLGTRPTGTSVDGTYARTRTYVCLKDASHKLQTVETVKEYSLFIEQSSGSIQVFDLKRAIKSVRRSGHNMDRKDALNIIHHAIKVLKSDFSETAGNSKKEHKPYSSKSLGLAILKTMLEKNLKNEWLRYALIFFSLNKRPSIPDELKGLSDIYSHFLWWNTEDRSQLIKYAKKLN